MASRKKKPEPLRTEERSAVGQAVQIVAVEGLKRLQAGNYAGALKSFSLVTQLVQAMAADGEEEKPGGTNAKGSRESRKRT